MPTGSRDSGAMTRRSMRFLGLTIEYDERVLEPREWTELQSRWAAELTAEADDGPLLELCSGAGHIGLGAASLTERPLVCVDVSDSACYFTLLNAERAGLEHRLEVREARLQEALADDELFALAIADPPWVTSDEVAGHDDDPVLAIDGGGDGLAIAHDCVEACVGHLPTGASLLLQLGSDGQADVVRDVAASRGWREHSRREAGPTSTSNGGVVLRLLHP